MGCYSRDADKFVVRLPEGMRGQIEASANQQDRSMNGVFVQAMRQYIDQQKHQDLLLDALAAAVKTANQSARNEENTKQGISLALYRVIDHIMMVALPVSESIKQSTIDSGASHLAAENAANQATRVAIMIREGLEQLFAPELLAAEKSSEAAESPYSKLRITNIDEWLKTVANAKRYEWLRNVAFDTPRQDLVPHDRMGNLLIEQDLDSEIDCAMHTYPGEQMVELCAN